MQPTVGRIVYYKSRGSADGKFPSVDRAAIVTDVRAMPSSNSENVPCYEIKATVFNPEGMFFTDWLDQGQNGGQWDWMPFQKASGTNQSQSAMVGGAPVTGTVNPPREMLGSDSNPNTFSN